MSRTDLCESAENPVRLTGQAAGLGTTWIGTLLDISERLALRRAERFTIVPGSDEDVTRLIAVIERQRRELDRIRAAAADQSVIAMARGALMERLGLSSAEAASQLANLSAATGMSLGEMAAAVLARGRARPGLPLGKVLVVPAGRAGASAPPGRVRSGPRPPPNWPPMALSSWARWPRRCWPRWARRRSCSGCWKRTAPWPCSARPACPAGRRAAGGAFRRSRTSPRSGSPAAALTCGGPPAVRTRGRSSVRRAGRAPCWRCGSGTGSCSG